MDSIFSLSAVISIMLSAYFSAVERVFHRYRRGIYSDELNDSSKYLKAFRKITPIFVTMVVGDLLSVCVFLYSAIELNISCIGGGLGGFYSFIIAFFILLLFGDVIPRLFVLRYSKLSFRFVASTLPIAVFALSPLWAPVIWLGRIISRSDDTDFHENEFFGSVTEDEIIHVVEAGLKSGSIETHEKKMIQSVIRFGDIIAREVMVPRTEVIAIEQGTSTKELLELITETGFTRLPVYREKIDNIVGVLNAKDLLQHFSSNLETKGIIEKVMHPPFFIPETKKIFNLLSEFNRSRHHMGIVVDEYGGTSGLITIEDILEEIVGEIQDEYDSPPLPDILKIGENEFQVLAQTPVDDVRETLKLNIEENEDYDSIGGFLTYAMGKIPLPGESLTYNEAVYTVLEADDRRILKVKVELKDSI